MKDSDDNKKINYKEIPLFELIELAQKDDYLALEELIKREQKNIYTAIYYLDYEHEDIADLTQEVLWKMTKNIKTLKNVKSFKPWLNQIISNVFYDELRKKKRKPKVVSIDTYFQNEESEETSPLKTFKDEKATPDEKSIQKELETQIKFFIKQLSPPFRMAIILRDIQGLSYEEIAIATKSSLGTVKSRIARARNKLQDSLKVYI